MTLYKHALPSLGEYLTLKGEIDFKKVDVIMADIAKVEEEMFRMRKLNEEKYE